MICFKCKLRPDDSGSFFLVFKELEVEPRICFWCMALFFGIEAN